MDECIYTTLLSEKRCNYIYYQEISYSLFVSVVLSSRKLEDDVKDSDIQKYKKLRNRVVESERSILVDFQVHAENNFWKSMKLLDKTWT